MKGISKQQLRESDRNMVRQRFPKKAWRALKVDKLPAVRTLPIL
jgi:hypothetical protein